jgi:hypothetical protein
MALSHELVSFYLKHKAIFLRVQASQKKEMKEMQIWANNFLVGNGLNEENL